MNRTITIIITIVVIITIVIGAYWFLFMRNDGGMGQTTTEETTNGFMPIDRSSSRSNSGQNISGNNDGATTTNSPGKIKIPKIRLLSNTPVGGYGASTTVVIVPIISSSSATTTGTSSTNKVSKTATTKPKTTMKELTVVRWIDRGRGNIYETNNETLDVQTLSNTIVPKVFSSVWNANLTAFVGSMFESDTSSISTIYATLKAQATSTVSGSNKNTSTSTTANKTNTKTAATSTSVNAGFATSTTSNQKVENKTPYELRGSDLPDNVVTYAASPKKDKLFILVNESGSGVGYISTFEGKSMTKIFDTPITQMNAEWPEENTIVITTKGTSSLNGYMYFVNPKTGVWKKIAGPLPGMSTKVNHDAKYAVISASSKDQNVLTSIFSIKDGRATNAVLRTMADKCVWGNFYKEMLYCAVPSEAIRADYPDDWYNGTIVTADKIWQINAETGEINLVSSIIDEADRLIDVFNLGLDKNDNYLFFMNKRDLSLWSLDLVSAK